jgi:hypothetical protein
MMKCPWSSGEFLAFLDNGDFLDADRRLAAANWSVNGVAAQKNGVSVTLCKEDAR